MFKGLLRGLKDLLYPNYCLTCGEKIPSWEKEPVCPACREKIEENLPPFCSRCGRHLPAEAVKKNTCPHCLDMEFYFDRAFSPCVYTGTVKKLIREFKYSGKDYLGRMLGEMMNDFIRQYRLPVEHLDFIIPLPLHRSRLREREFNQAEVLSRIISGQAGIKILERAIIRMRPTGTQTELDLRKRRLNMEGSFRVILPEEIRGKNILLVDDVLTSGATSNEAAKALKESGARKVILFTLAS
ncbi:MAG: ComF family protein [Candidatus Omnitrophica bacterium]|jgi:ComF family protein|nr:ComF family protein [Candidatus Omnitrophota bacterium]MDD5078115.1 ComF family protein [Candidatus Omnitrophota bacterium]